MASERLGSTRNRAYRAAAPSSLYNLQESFLFSSPLKLSAILISTFLRSNPEMLRAKFHIYGIDSSKID
jgi:hypothetical protein